MSRRKNIPEKIEPINNNIWLKRSKGFLKFLSTWRSWDEIVQWAYQNNLTEYSVRNLMAYVDGIILYKNKQWINKQAL